MSPVDRAAPSYKMRHSTAHVMAQAVAEMFLGAKLAWGPTHDGSPTASTTTSTCRAR